MSDETKPKDDVETIGFSDRPTGTSEAMTLVLELLLAAQALPREFLYASIREVDDAEEE